jgi:hypothetical protein
VQMLATRTRDLLRFRQGGLPAGKTFADKRGHSALISTSISCDPT